MRPENPVPLTPRMEEAVQELKGVITTRFPQATFVVEEGADPKGIYLLTTVDIPDTDEVIDLVGDRLIELQVGLAASAVRKPTVRNECPLSGP